MAKPMADAAAGVVQQMIQEDGCTMAHQRSDLNLGATAPAWANPETTGMAWAAEGWTPSGPISGLGPQR